MRSGLQYKNFARLTSLVIRCVKHVTINYLDERGLSFLKTCQYFSWLRINFLYFNIYVFWKTFWFQFHTNNCILMKWFNEKNNRKFPWSNIAFGYDCYTEIWAAVYFHDSFWKKSQNNDLSFLSNHGTNQNKKCVVRIIVLTYKFPINRSLYDLIP